MLLPYVYLTALMSWLLCKAGCCYLNITVMIASREMSWFGKHCLLWMGSVVRSSTMYVVIVC